jgi:hypothetical protein
LSIGYENKVVDAGLTFVLCSVVMKVTATRILIPDGHGHGRWAPLLRSLAALPREARRLTPRLTVSDIRSLRSAARWRHWRLHVRTGLDATEVWLGDSCEGFEKYRRKQP